MSVNIPIDYLKKYEMAFEGETTEQSMAHYESEKVWLQQFLNSSDYVGNKIIEAQYSGEEPEDLTEIVNIRKECRNRIRELEANNE